MTGEKETGSPSRAPSGHAQKKTFCRICEAHCGLRVDFDAQGAISSLRPDRDHPVSQGYVCAKGTRFLELANHPERLMHPLVRQPDGTYQAVSWQEALSYFQERIRPILKTSGPHAVALYLGTPAIHNSLGALAYVGLARALGTRNVYSVASQDNASKMVASRLVHGNEWIAPIVDLDHADFALLLGTNPAVSQGTYMHLRGGTTAFDRFKKRGGDMVIVDPRRTESVERWGGHVPIHPGTDIFLLLALLHALRDLAQPNARVSGLDELLSVAAEYPAERAARLTGIPLERIRALASSIRQAEGATFFLSVGVNQGPFGTLSSVALQALAYLSGNFDRQGGLLFQPWGVVLGWLFHMKPQRSRIGAYRSNAGGLPAGILADEILTKGSGQIRALIVMSGNPLTTAPDETRLRQAFQQLDVLVCIDLFQNQTGQEADLLLPATTWLERFDVGAWNAMFTQAPFLESTSPMRPAPQACRPEWQILLDLSVAAGRPLLGLLARLVRAVNWDTLLQPVIEVTTFPFKRFMRGGRGIPWRPPIGGSYVRGKRHVRFWHPELQSERERLARYAAEQSQVHTDAATLTLLSRRRRLGQSSWIHGATRDGNTEASAWLCLSDMERLGIQEGEDIFVSSDAGSIRLPAWSHEGVLPGMVVVPHGLPEVNVNTLIGSDRSLIEPVSGMHRMTGNQVHVQRAHPRELPVLAT
jgi:anaerobic selenocysteine-containing dehydrogenase